MNHKVRSAVSFSYSFRIRARAKHVSRKNFAPVKSTNTNLVLLFQAKNLGISATRLCPLLAQSGLLRCTRVSGHGNCAAIRPLSARRYHRTGVINHCIPFALWYRRKRAKGCSGWRRVFRPADMDRGWNVCWSHLSGRRSASTISQRQAARPFAGDQRHGSPRSSRC